MGQGWQGAGGRGEGRLAPKSVEAGRRRGGRGWRGAWACMVLMLAACGASQQDTAPGSGFEEGTSPPESVGPPPENTGTPPENTGTPPVTPPSESCRPLRCEDRGASCGAVSDGCGGTLSCGTCGLGQTCGGGGRANACGTPDYGLDTACSKDGVCFLNPKPVSHDFKDVWGRSVDDFWAVGDAGFIVHGGANGLTVLPEEAELSGIWGSAAEDVWAVGSRIDHFDGRRWSPALSPERFLRDIHGTGAGNVWAVGEGGLAYVWNGTRWNKESTGTSADLYGVWTYGGEVWAVGTGSTVRVRDAKGWRAMTAPAPEVTLTGIWGSGPEDVWVTGSKSGAVLFHWDGRAWTSVQLPFSALYGISGGSATDLLVVGEEGMARYDGSRWATLPSSTPTRFLGAWHASDGALVVGAAGHVQRLKKSLWSALDQGSRADFIAVSAPEEDSHWWFADGRGLRVGTGSDTYTETGPANAMAEQGPGGLWVAGNFGRAELHTWDSYSSGTQYFYLPQSFSFRGVLPIPDRLAWLVGTDTASGETVLVQVDGSFSWTRYPLVARGALNAIDGSAVDDVWAAGDSVLAHWDGATWSELSGAGLPSFRAVRVLGRDMAWALGPSSLWRWSGTGWASVALPAGLGTTELRALFADSREELYVAGDDGLLLHYDVNRGLWRRIDTGTHKSLRDISGGRRMLVLAGEDGTVLRLYR
jgi:hypothetical protein